MSGRDILISNGFNRFHMSVAAAEMARRERLAMMLTGAYPTPHLRGCLKTLGLTRHRRIARFIDRYEEIPDDLIQPLSISEAMYDLRSIAERLNRLSFHKYAYDSVAFVRKAHERGARLFHYRAGFGHESVQEAKRLGMVTLCDHSIVHPSLLDALVKNSGKFPDRKDCLPMDDFWEDVLADITLADHVLVNSHFVSDSFMYLGWPGNRLSVIYLGLDRKFLEDIPARPAQRSPGPLRILFAGSFGKRKGADILLRALQKLGDADWELCIAGAIEPEVYEQYQHGAASGKIRHLGVLNRRELPKTMVKADLFVFPSLAEGSARVVFEALACGLPIITTPNSGSIVQDRKHGWLVPPGDAESLEHTLRHTMAYREDLPAIGTANASHIRMHYMQTHYGDNLIELYDRLLEGVK